MNGTLRSVGLHPAGAREPHRPRARRLAQLRRVPHRLRRTDLPCRSPQPGHLRGGLAQPHAGLPQRLQAGDADVEVLVGDDLASRPGRQAGGVLLHRAARLPAGGARGSLQRQGRDGHLWRLGQRADPHQPVRAASSRWMLKEFKTVLDCGSSPCKFEITPIPVKVNPWGELWNEDVANSPAQPAPAAAPRPSRTTRWRKPPCSATRS